MYFERLNEQNVEQYIDYLKLAMQQEPDMMTVEEIDEEGIRTCLLYTSPSPRDTR